MAIRKRTWINAAGEQTAWVVDYRDAEGVRRLKTFARKKEADAWATRAAYELSQGTHTAARASVTIAEAGDLWLDRCAAEGLEQSTLRQRQQHLRLHINPYLRATRLADLTAPRVNAFLDALRNDGRSLAMRRKVLTSLKAILNYSQARGLVAQNVARGIRLGGNGRERAAIEMPSKAELRAMIDGAEPRYRPLIVTAIFTGMRASELRGLRWEDVDLDAGALQVRQRADKWGKLGAPKSKAGHREIPLAPMVVNALREWRLACPKGNLGLVFPNGAGRVESLPNIWNRAFGPLQVRCGITGLTPPEARASCPVPRFAFSFGWPSAQPCSDFRAAAASIA